MKRLFGDMILNMVRISSAAGELNQLGSVAIRKKWEGAVKGGRNGSFMATCLQMFVS